MNVLLGTTDSTRVMYSRLNSPNSFFLPPCKWLPVLMLAICGAGFCQSRVSAQTQPIEVEANTVWTLDDLERRALQTHPSLKAAALRVSASDALALQAGLAPNPSLALFGAEVANEGHGQFGVQWSRTHLRGDQRQFNSAAQRQKSVVLDKQLATQSQRIVTAVNIAFYKLLIARRQLELASQLSQTQQQAIENTKKLVAAGESPKTELLQFEIQAQRIEMRLATTRISKQNAWRELAALTSLPDSESQNIVGSLDKIVDQLSWENTLATLLENSPQAREAQARVDQTYAAIQQQLAQSVPNLNSQISLGLDTGSENVFGGFQFGMPLQVNNWNQGNIAAARSSHYAAVAELENVNLSLTQRLVSVFQKYQVAYQQTKVYSEQMLPRARETVELLTQAFQEGEASFVQLLTAQQNLINLTSEYLDSLFQLWLARQTIEGFLLLDE